MNFPVLPDAAAAQSLLDHILAQPAAAGPRRLDGPFALYGAGKLGLMAMDFFNHVGLLPDLVIDRNAAALAGDLAWQGCRMVAPEQVPAQVRASLPLVVGIATTCFTDLAEELRAQGWCDIVPIYDVTEAYRDRYPLGNGWFMGDLDGAGRDALGQVLDGWSDDHSRAYHLQFIAWHRLRQDWRFAAAPVDLEHRYFIPEVMSVLGGAESFLDVGAHRGEVAQAFRTALGNQFQEIVLIEPDSDNAAAVAAGLDALAEPVRRRHRLLRLALSHSGGRRGFFAGLGYGSQLSSLGRDVVEVRTLDELALAPSYLKLHLEGHELDALRGGLATLRRQRPLVAVTVYHSDAGLWQLPGWLMAQLDGYRFHLRLHSWCGTGAVMYCVPGERAVAA